MSEQSEDLSRIKDEYRTLEQSWKEENEKFIQFQLLANRDLQLVNHVLTENQKVQLSVKKQIEKDKSKASSPKFPNSDSLDCKNIASESDSNTFSPKR